MSETVPASRKRADARRNEDAVLSAAAEVFARAGVDAPVRDIAVRAGVGVGTIYRHFPTRSELVVAVYRHQVRACADAGPLLLASSATAEEALRRWVDLFVDFLVTKHGLANALQGAQDDASALHSFFVETLVPVCGAVLAAAVKERHPGDAPHPDPYVFLKGIGNLCIGAGRDPGYAERDAVGWLVSGALAAPA
ncbi:TetR/AcrR family transcriptional regulator [Leifsonia sp. AG29]|uniref:TetR/AcrR family transcriptional regulator n=1 Tax=Leifsonia sp. AG29 TaxID=2598860 RepID=UPI00131BB602|nr:TetR/AcrR family transcriptional regulator [Leifsonia sp. AG29]